MTWIRTQNNIDKFETHKCYKDKLNKQKNLNHEQLLLNAQLQDEGLQDRMYNIDRQTG